MIMDTSIDFWNRLIKNRWMQTHWGKQYMASYLWARYHPSTIRNRDIDLRIKANKRAQERWRSMSDYEKTVYTALSNVCAKKGINRFTIK